MCAKSAFSGTSRGRGRSAGHDLWEVVGASTHRTIRRGENCCREESQAGGRHWVGPQHSLLRKMRRSAVPNHGRGRGGSGKETGVSELEKNSARERNCSILSLTRVRAR